MPGSFPHLRLNLTFVSLGFMAFPSEMDIGESSKVGRNLQESGVDRYGEGASQARPAEATPEALDMSRPGITYQLRFSFRQFC